MESLYVPVSVRDEGKGSIACISFSLGMMAPAVGESNSLEVWHALRLRYRRSKIAMTTIAKIDPPTAPPMIGLMLVEELDF